MAVTNNNKFRNKKKYFVDIPPFLIDLSGTVNTVNVLSYNLHGLNQGRPLLVDLLHSGTLDFCFVQEHWLSSINMSDLTEIDPNYGCISVSGMEEKLAGDILYGRPFGGVAIFFKHSYAGKLKCLHSSSRLIILSFDNFILINVYLPSKGKNDTDICKNDGSIEEILENINDSVTNLDMAKTNILMGGDINRHLVNENGVFDCMQLNDFITRNDFLLANVKVKPNLDYTYQHVGLGQKSMVDFFFINKSLADKIIDHRILENGGNLSDHLPVAIMISNDSMKEVETGFGKSNRVWNNVTKQLRWDRANLFEYYNQTGELIYPLYEELRKFENSKFLCEQCLGLGVLDMKLIQKNCCKIKMYAYIDDVYNRFVMQLNHASQLTIPLTGKNFFKHWWDLELNELKMKSYEACAFWKQSGSPRSGPIFQLMSKHKFLYKQRINEKREESRLEVTNDLHSALLNKNNTQFWKSWNNKFNSTKTIPKMVDGINNDQSIANAFAGFFKSCCVANNEVKSEMLKMKGLQDFDNYKINCSMRDYFLSVEEISIIICNLKKGKASGFDGLTAEHFFHAHPVVISFIAKFVNVLLSFSYVPNDFGIGVTVPIPKSNISKCSWSVKDFRGITISPVVSKIFENCIMLRFGHLLGSSSFQFGFKKGYGCRDVLYTLKNVVNHYIENGSTVNLCTLDITKAFDRVNIYGLLSKLIDRKVPKCIISIIKKWYENGYIFVKWNNATSFIVKLSHGVRQGGVLSPILFAVYVDDMLCKLNSSDIGCKYNGLPLAALMYADDIILISASVTQLQTLIKICDSSLEEIDLRINISKSFWIRIGCRHLCTCANLSLGTETLPVSKEIIFLGTNVVGASKFMLSLSTNKVKFFRNANRILCKIGNSDLPVLFHLINAYCISALVYNIEIFDLTKSNISSLMFVVNRLFMKICKTSLINNVNYCLYCFGQLPIDILLEIRKCKYLNNLLRKSDIISSVFYEKILSELNVLVEKWRMSGHNLNYPCKPEGWSIFENRLVIS